MPIIILKQKNINYKNKTLWLNTSQDDVKKNEYWRTMSGEKQYKSRQPEQFYQVLLF